MTEPSYRWPYAKEWLAAVEQGMSAIDISSGDGTLIPAVRDVAHRLASRADEDGFLGPISNYQICRLPAGARHGLLVWRLLKSWSLLYTTPRAFDGVTANSHYLIFPEGS